MQDNCCRLKKHYVGPYHQKKTKYYLKNVELIIITSYQYTEKVLR